VRGKRLVVLVGQRKALAIAVRNQGSRRSAKLREHLAGTQNRTGADCMTAAVSDAVAACSNSDSPFQPLGSAEGNLLAGRNLHHLACGRIAARARLALTHLKRAKAAYPDAVTPFFTVLSKVGAAGALRGLLRWAVPADAILIRRRRNTRKKDSRRAIAACPSIGKTSDDLERAEKSEILLTFED
jgi:hypothetical protein